jgi:hypothetical protein
MLFNLNLEFICPINTRQNQQNELDKGQREQKPFLGMPKSIRASLSLHSANGMENPSRASWLVEGWNYLRSSAFRPLPD